MSINEVDFIPNDDVQLMQIEGAPTDVKVFYYSLTNSTGVIIFAVVAYRGKRQTPVIIEVYPTIESRDQRVSDWLKSCE